MTKKNEVKKVDTKVMRNLEEKVEKTYVVYEGCVMSFEKYKELIKELRDNRQNRQRGCENTQPLASFIYILERVD